MPLPRENDDARCHTGLKRAFERSLSLPASKSISPGAAGFDYHSSLSHRLAFITGVQVESNGITV
jgi:hypothetical protein